MSKFEKGDKVVNLLTNEKGFIIHQCHAVDRVSGNGTEAVDLARLYRLCDGK